MSRGFISLVLFFAISPLAALASDGDGKQKATLCIDAVCKLPDCHCAGTRVPKGLKPETIPQFVMISLDGRVSKLNYDRVERIFGQNRVNPNGCPIRGTFFVNHEWNDYNLTSALYVKGHEIATHAITRKSMEAFKKADIDRWVKEIGGMKKILEIFAGIPAEDIKGFRAPYLKPGGDIMFDAMNQTGITYDSTLVAGENNPPIWPYTLEYKSSQDCKVEKCPRNSHPGLWEVPLVQHFDDSDPKRVCSVIDACQDRRTKESARDMLLDNFLRHYTSNRAPFPLFMHAWFDTGKYRMEAFLEFLETILLLPDVYVVPISDVLEWIKNPVPCERPASEEEYGSCRLEAMKSWSCHNEAVSARQPVCDADEIKYCVVKKKDGKVERDRGLITCKSCPDVYPWLGNPDGNLLQMEGVEIDESEKALWYPPRGINLTHRVEEKVVDPFASFKKMDPRDRFKMYLQRKLKNNNINLNVAARVLGNIG